MLELFSNLSEHCFAVVTWIHFWSTLSNRSTHLADNFFMRKCSCKILNSFEMFTFLAITRTYTLQSSNTISWILLAISAVLISVGHLNTLHLLCFYGLREIRKSLVNHTMWWRRVLVIFFKLSIVFSPCKEKTFYQHQNHFFTIIKSSTSIVCYHR